VQTMPTFNDETFHELYSFPDEFIIPYLVWHRWGYIWVRDDDYYLHASKLASGIIPFMETRDLLAYGDGAIKKLHETLLANPEGFEVTFGTISKFKGVRELIAHLVGAEERWYGHTQGKPPAARYEDNAALTMDGLFGDWQLRRDRLKEFYFGLDSAELTAPISVKLAYREEPVPMTPNQIVYQVINHQLYHTGQISMALQQASIDPPNFDYVLYLCH